MIKSSTQLAIGPGEAPIWLKLEKLLGKTALQPLMLTLPGVGLKDLVPVKEAGILKDPPRSEPKAKGTHLAATKAASPPELPPHDLD